MKFTFLFLVLIATASAQSDGGKLLEQGLHAAITGLAPVPEKERVEILATATAQLTKHVTFRPDGTQSAIRSSTVRQQVEWKGLKIQSITGQYITEADRLNGTSKRFLVSLSCDAHRSWDTQANAWGKWYPINNVTFPAAIIVEWQGDKWVALESDQIKYFTPGPGGAIVTPKNPEAKSDGLPQGMTRVR